MGIEPTLAAWEAAVLPLNYTRAGAVILRVIASMQQPRPAARAFFGLTDWTRQYYSEEAKAKVDARRHLWSPELQERVTKQWNELFRDVETALGEDPASETAQALFARWRTLIEGFTGGDAEIQKGLNRMYSDMPHWPADRRAAFGIRPEIQEFITKAMRASR